MISSEALQKFSDKHCRGKVARLDLLADMCEALGVRITVRPISATPENGAREIIQELREAVEALLETGSAEDEARAILLAERALKKTEAAQ